MAKIGKKKLAELSEISKRKSAACSESDENPEANGASSSSDEAIAVDKSSKNKHESSSKKPNSSKASSKTTIKDTDSDESDDLPLNGNKTSSSRAPPRKKQKKAPTAKVNTSTTGKNRNKKSSTKSNDTEPEDNAENNDNKDGDDEYEVEAIMGHKVEGNESFFLVRWKGYGKEDDSWEPEAELNCEELIKAYRKKPGSKKSTLSGKKTTATKAGRGRKINKTTESDPDKEWAVERIVDYVDDDEHGCLYRIRWKGFGAKEDTWEPESNLSCESLIEKFKKNLEEQRNVDVKQLRESPKKTKRLVNETIPRSNLHNRIERSSKRAAAKNRVFYGEE